MSALVVVLAVAGAIAFLVAQPVLGSGPRWEGPKADPALLERLVRGLVGVGHRDTPAGMDRAAAWISTQLRDIGLGVVEQEYQLQGETFRNVIARVGPDTAETIVVGAHYDAAGPLPGADDNASGVAGLLEIARLLRARPPGLRVQLVFYPNEEPPSFHGEGMGSVVHARSLDPRTVRATIVLEMIGCFSEPQQFPFAPMRLLYPSRGDFIAVVGRMSDALLVRDVKRAMRGAEGLRVRSIDAPRAVPGVDFSDHASYWDAGIRAVMVTDTAFYRNPRYHTARDTPDTLDYRAMSRVAEGVALAVHALAS